MQQLTKNAFSQACFFLPAEQFVTQIGLLKGYRTSQIMKTHRDKGCIFDCSRTPWMRVEPQRSCAAVKWLSSLFCQTSESIISYTNGLNYDQMSWVTCCHEAPCESCFIRSQHVLLSAKPCLLALSEGSSRPGLRVPFPSLGPPLPLNCFTQRLPSMYFHQTNIFNHHLKAQWWWKGINKTSLLLC